MDNRIAVLTSHSLLADGLVARLLEYSEQLEFQVFDIGQAEILSQIRVFQPLAIILEEERSQQYEVCSLKNILTAFPNITIVYLRSGESTIQVILSRHFKASGVRELVKIIRPSS